MPEWNRLNGRLGGAVAKGGGVGFGRPDFPSRVIHQWEPAEPVLGWVLASGGRGSARRQARVWRHCVAVARSLGYGGIDVGFLTRKADSSTDDHATTPVQTLAAIALERDLVVLAWGSLADVGQAHVAVDVIWRQLAAHGGSLAVLGWTPDGHPAGVDAPPKTPVLNCLCCAPALSGDPRYAHDWRFDRLLEAAA
ncbi:MAG: hypothetical protein PHQ28_00600 [Mycobacterium sp.]|nr:hypothetical protein [Mycobacterium sp.]